MNIPGFSTESLEQVSEMLNFSDKDWKQQFETGKNPPANKENYEGDPWFHRNKEVISDIDSRAGVQKGSQGKRKVNRDAEMLTPTSYPKGPGNPQGGSSKDVQGLRMLG